MKKFIFKLSLYALLILALTVCINALYIRLDQSDSDSTSKFKSIPENIEICNLGSSHGLYGYDYQDIADNYTCFNFALVSQTLSYDYRLLDYYQDNLKKGCVVIINISYFSFLGSAEEKNADFESKNKRYYKILDKSHIKQYSAQTDFYKDYPALNDGVELIRAFTGRLMVDQHPEWNQTADDIDLQKDVEAANERHLGTNQIDDEGNVIINQEEIDALYLIIQMCKENEWIPILVTTPFLSEYSSFAWTNHTDALNTVYEIIDEVQKNTGIAYYDYSLDERINSRHDLFMNGDHLNKDGARKYTNILFDEVIEPAINGL